MLKFFLKHAVSLTSRSDFSNFDAISDHIARHPVRWLRTQLSASCATISFSSDLLRSTICRGVVVMNSWALWWDRLCIVVEDSLVQRAVHHCWSALTVCICGCCSLKIKLVWQCRRMSTWRHKQAGISRHLDTLQLNWDFRAKNLDVDADAAHELVIDNSMDSTLETAKKINKFLTRKMVALKFIRCGSGAVTVSTWSCSLHIFWY